MFRMANIMRMLSCVYHVVFIAVNQVSTRLDGFTPRTVQPALGLAWTHCVNQRLLLQRCDGQGTFDPIVDPIYAPERNEIKQKRVIRSARVVFSPLVPTETRYFVVNADGLHSVS